MMQRSLCWLAVACLWLVGLLLVFGAHLPPVLHAPSSLGTQSPPLVNSESVSKTTPAHVLLLLVQPAGPYQQITPTSQGALSGMANAAVRLGDLHTASCNLSDLLLLCRATIPPAHRSPAWPAWQVLWHTLNQRWLGCTEPKEKSVCANAGTVRRVASLPVAVLYRV